ncbi:acyl-CoA thioesterase [Aliibacillus thermotolerans]|uniref:Acyl-CoA thioesterase n=1 Tax=Aliibacillus thermotolerans TaxID=1834418 RepID=A0ABW0U6D2_9BACI|nr:thioesterase family protein [Aliibacillus thermotolerans]MDA3129935.1 YbgC/FadM family acyl-CoA thioesterase [Aliibacillus thermotolerans]
MEIKVRVNETDMLGHINHASYFTYMEEARLDFLRGLGMDVKDENFMIVLASATCDFIQQGYFGQSLEVQTTVKKIGTTSFTLGNDILEKESNELIAQGEVTVVYFDKENQKPTPLPAELKEQLQAHISPHNETKSS